MLFDKIDFDNKSVKAYLVCFFNEVRCAAKREREKVIKRICILGNNMDYNLFLMQLRKCVVKFKSNVEERLILYNVDEITFQMLPNTAKSYIINQSSINLRDESGKSIIDSINSCLGFMSIIENVSEVYCMQTAENAIRQKFGDDAFFVASVIKRINFYSIKGLDMENIFSREWVNPTTTIRSNTNTDTNTDIFYNLHGAL